MPAHRVVRGPGKLASRRFAGRSVGDVAAPGRQEFVQQGLDAGRQAETVYFSPVAARFMQYRLTTNIFYYQSLVLWGLLVVLTACKLLSSL